VRHRGLTLLTHSQEARTVIEEFVKGPMGEGCRVMEPKEATEFCPGAKPETLTGALYSPHELRVESREAVHQVAAWLVETMGVTIVRPTTVLKVAPPIIGKSTHSFEQAVAAEAEGADYIGFGPLFATPTKPGRPAIGLADLRRVQAAVRIPVFCIGGIKRANLEAVLAAGARRVVIVSEMLGAADIAGYAREVKAALRAAAGA
jgi:hypothetical protein